MVLATTEFYDVVTKRVVNGDNICVKQFKNGRYGLTAKSSDGRNLFKFVKDSSVPRLLEQYPVCRKGSRSRKSSARRTKAYVRKSCKANQYRDPITGRCRLKTSQRKTAYKRKSCKANQYRDPSTGRCRLKTSKRKTAYKRKSCKANQYRDAKTGRCRLRTSQRKPKRARSRKACNLNTHEIYDNKCLKKCKDDQVRRETTKRCVKFVVPKSRKRRVRKAPSTAELLRLADRRLKTLAAQTQRKRGLNSLRRSIDRRRRAGRNSDSSPSLARLIDSYENRLVI